MREGDWEVVRGLVEMNQFGCNTHVHGSLAKNLPV
jgi:hypothetical protein